MLSNPGGRRQQMEATPSEVGGSPQTCEAERLPVSPEATARLRLVQRANGSRDTGVEVAVFATAFRVLTHAVGLVAGVRAHDAPRLLAAVATELTAQWRCRRWGRSDEPAG